MPEDAQYRLAIAAGEPQLIAAAVEIRHGEAWIPVQQWSLACSRSTTVRQRRELLLAAADEFGWILPDGRWPAPRRDGRRFVPGVKVANYRIALRHASKYRHTRIEEFIRIDQAWRALVTAASSAVGGSSAAEAAGVSRWRVYQIVRDPYSSELGRVVETTTQHAQQRQPNKVAEPA